jgi:hypothetical protein
VSWTGSDDAAGISLYEIRVSKDGGPFTLWRTAAEPGSATFVATQTGSYSFRAVARDGADNIGQSALAGLNLKTVAPPPEPTLPPPPAPPPPTPAAPIATAPPIVTQDTCAADAAKAYRRAVKAAKRKRGKARAKAVKNAAKQKAKRLARCRVQR